MSNLRKPKSHSSETNVADEGYSKLQSGILDKERKDSSAPSHMSRPVTSSYTQSQFVPLNTNHDDDEDSELFPSLEEYHSDQNNDEQHPRPPSQNSITNMLKYSFHEAKQMIHQSKQMMHQCGVGVGDHHQVLESGAKPREIANQVPEKFHSKPSKTLSSPVFFEKQKQHHMNEKQVPFPLSVYPSSSASMNDFKSQSAKRGYDNNRNNNRSIPLQHSQSAPFKPEPIQHLFMRRSASTPTTFNIGKGRSAFQSIDGSNRIRAGSYSTPQVKKSISVTSMSDSKCQDNILRRMEFAKELSLPTPAKIWLSDKISRKVQANYKEDQKDVNSCASNDDSFSSSSAFSKSNIMNSKTQRKIKERLKERRKVTASKTPDECFPSNDKSIGEKQDSFVVPGEKVAIADTQINDFRVDIVEDDNAEVSYLPLEFENQQFGGFIDEENHRIDEETPMDFPSIFSTQKLSKRNVESPTPVPQPAYQKIVDDELPSPNHLHTNPPLPVPHSRRISRTPPSPIVRVATPPSKFTQKRLILKGNTSPCSHDSASYSRTSRSLQSVNTSAQTHSTSISGNISCSRSITSSVAEADKEVRDLNRRELKRRGKADFDGTMSIQSSDTTSTNAYLALTSSPAQLREGANIHYDRFFSNNSIGPVNSQSSHASSYGQSWNQSQQYSSPGMSSRNPTSVRSPITVSSNSISNTNSSTSTGEDPPRIVSCASNLGPLNANRGEMPPRSDQQDSSLGYSQLGSSKHKSKSRSSSKSSSSKSKSSKSKKKDHTRLYQKIGSAKVADHYTSMRTSTPSPSNSYQTSPKHTPITPPSHFDYPSELIDVPKPKVHRQLPVQLGNGSKLVLVSPSQSEGRKNSTTLRPTGQNFWQPSIHQQRVFQPLESVVTPERNS